MTQVEALQNLTGLHWRRASPDHIESTDGQWQIWKLRTEVPAYTLWKRGRKGWDHVANYDSSEEAKARAGR